MYALGEENRQHIHEILTTISMTRQFTDLRNFPIFYPVEYDTFKGSVLVNQIQCIVTETLILRICNFIFLPNMYYLHVWTPSPESSASSSSQYARKSELFALAEINAAVNPTLTLDTARELELLLLTSINCKFYLILYVFILWKMGS